MEIGKPDINHETDTTTLTLGAYSYPLRVYGTPALDKEGKPVTDDLGNQKVVMLMRSLPCDIDYGTFGDAVQIPKLKAEAPPEDPETPEV